MFLTLNDRLFIGNFGEKQVATINWMKGLNNDYNFSFLIDGYKLAFLTLIEQAIKLPEDEIVQRDYFINPILFCLRHYIELICKDTIRKFNMGQQKTNADEIGFDQTHDISILFKMVKNIFEKHQPCHTGEIISAGFLTQLTATEKIVGELCVYDPLSFSFRYPYKKTKSVTDKLKDIIPETSIDLNNLKSTADKLILMLECLNSEASAFRTAEQLRIEYGIT